MEVFVNWTEVKYRIKQAVKLLISLSVGNSSHELHPCCCSAILYCICKEGDGNSNYEASVVWILYVTIC